MEEFGKAVRLRVTREGTERLIVYGSVRFGQEDPSEHDTFNVIAQFVAWPKNTLEDEFLIKQRAGRPHSPVERCENTARVIVVFVTTENLEGFRRGRIDTDLVQLKYSCVRLGLEMSMSVANVSLNGTGTGM